MRDVRLRELRHFLLVVETKNFGTAAKRAFRSQPALSQSIRQLERRLGQPLFEKGSRTTLTPFGHKCLPLIHDLVTNVDRTVSSMQQVAQISGGRVSIAMTPSVATHLLPSLLASFVTSYPGVEIDVHAEDSRKVHRLVVDGIVDIGVSSLQKPDPNIRFTPLMQDRFGVLCRADHAFATSPGAIAWDQLRHQPILGNLSQYLLVDSPAWPLIAHPKVQLSNLPTLFSLVTHGLGVTLIPALASPTNAPDLAFVPLVKPVTTRTIGMMALAGRSLLPAAQAIVELIYTQLKDPNWMNQHPMVKLSSTLKRVARAKGDVTRVATRV